MGVYYYFYNHTLKESNKKGIPSNGGLKWSCKDYGVDVFDEVIEANKDNGWKRSHVIVAYPDYPDYEKYMCKDGKLSALTDDDFIKMEKEEEEEENEKVIYKDGEIKLVLGSNIESEKEEEKEGSYVVIIHSGCNKDIPFVYDVIPNTKEALAKLREKLGVISEKEFDYHHESEDNEDNMLTGDIEMKIPMSKLEEITKIHNFPIMHGGHGDVTVYLFDKDEDRSAFDYIDDLCIV